MPIESIARMRYNVLIAFISWQRNEIRTWRTNACGKGKCSRSATEWHNCWSLVRTQETLYSAKNLIKAFETKTSDHKKNEEQFSNKCQGVCSPYSEESLL